MVINDESRHELFVALEGAIGHPATATLMAHLPPVGWADVATKSDLRTEIALLRSELRTEIAELRAELKGDIADLRTELKGDIADLRTELKGDIAVLRYEIQALEVTFHRELATQLSAQLRTFVLATMGTTFTAVGLAFTAGHFSR